MTNKKTEYRDNTDGHATHDVGGLDFGSVDMSEHDLAFWERRVDAIITLMATKKSAFKIDAMRRIIESYGEQEYDTTTYYEKWTRALRNLVIEQGIVTRAELTEQLAKSRKSFQDAGRETSQNDVPWNEGLWGEEAS